MQVMRPERNVIDKDKETMTYSSNNASQNKGLHLALSTNLCFIYQFPKS